MTAAVRASTYRGAVGQSLFPEFWRKPSPPRWVTQVPAQADPRAAFKGMQSGQGRDPVLESPPCLVSWFLCLRPEILNNF